MRHWRRWVLGVVVVGLVALGADVRLVVFPTVQRPGATDLVVVLGGAYRPGEIPTARSVKRLNPGVVLLVSDPYGPCPTISRTQVCFTPRPDTTEGEARFGSAYAAQHHLRSVTVVAPTYQVSRARLWFGRCWSGRLSVVAPTDSIWDRVKQIPYQTAGTIKAEVFERHC